MYTLNLIILSNLLIDLSILLPNLIFFLYNLFDKIEIL